MATEDRVKLEAKLAAQHQKRAEYEGAQLQKQLEAKKQALERQQVELSKQQRHVDDKVRQVNELTGKS